MNIPREYVRLCSLALFGAGAIVLIFGGWQVEQQRAMGITLMAGAIWFVLMSESMLLSKVHNEMSTALEALRKKQEAEVQDLLYFLRRSKIACEPLECQEGASRWIRCISSPAMVLSVTHQIVEVNDVMLNILEYERKDLVGKGAHVINNPLVMSKIGQEVERHNKEGSMWTRYVYIGKKSNSITGTMTAGELKDRSGYLIHFYPDNECVIDDEQIRMIVNE